MMSDVYRAGLRRLAEQATPGPWKTTWRYGLYYVGRIMSASMQPQPRRDHEGFLSGIKREPEVVFIGTDTDAAYIAAANPATMLALLDALEKAEGHRDSLAATLIEVQREKLALERAIERVRALHGLCHTCSPARDPHCDCCDEDWPCLTISALYGGESA